jgi:membrane protein implicated in regulation of membrane protease activity
MIPAKLWGMASVATLIGGMIGAVIAQAATWDVTAIVTYVGAVGLAALALYSKAREEKRKQDGLDRESRRDDCEKELAEVRGDVAELKQRNGDLKSELDRWKALFDSSQHQPRPRPPQGPPP